MKLVLERLHFGDTFTIGQLLIDGVFECWTLEDQTRSLGVKVPGKTSIPYGTFPIDITYSPHFARELPLLKDVPGWDGVRIHSGNTVSDTEGCILVGMDRYGDGRVGRSRDAFRTLMPKLQKAKDDNDVITLDITRPQPGDVLA
jgi:hypothetical protein